MEQNRLSSMLMQCLQEIREYDFDVDAARKAAAAAALAAQQAEELRMAFMERDLLGDGVYDSGDAAMGEHRDLLLGPIWQKLQSVPLHQAGPALNDPEVCHPCSAGQCCLESTCPAVAAGSAVSGQSIAA